MKEDVSDGQIGTLSRLCLRMTELVVEREELEKRLDEIKHEYREYSENLIPATMGELGLDSITRGRLTIEIADEVRASLPKDQERRMRALNYVRSTGDEGLVKTEFIVSYGRDQDNEAVAFAALLSTGVAGGAQITSDQTIHHQSLLKYLREQLRAGANVPMEDFGAFVTKVARVKMK